MNLCPIIDFNVVVKKYTPYRNTHTRPYTTQSNRRDGYRYSDTH